MTEGSALLQQSFDLLDGIDDGADAHLVVDGSDEVGAVLGAVNIKVPAALQQVGLAVGQVASQIPIMMEMVMTKVMLTNCCAVRLSILPRVSPMALTALDAAMAS